ncbi:hypothetical protein AB0I22_31845 [Streptomyces sp. NPDC050610]|uniref:glycine-rich domain-containing protein n=1 Tax=Streptomyces sp. NPDC050610 TaxID=3157097 RepID=UPI003412A250
MHDARALLTPAAFGGVVATVLGSHPGMEEAAAERIVAEALKFVDAAAQFPAVKITPSAVVEEGWHALILHTNLYEGLCDRLGRFVHHWPGRPGAERPDEQALARTVTMIEQAGHTVDGELWAASARVPVPVAAGVPVARPGSGPARGAGVPSSGE